MTAMPLFEYHCKERDFRFEALIMGSALEPDDCDSQSIETSLFDGCPGATLLGRYFQKQRIEIG